MDALEDYPGLSQWPQTLGPVPTHALLVQAYALLRAARLSNNPEGTRDALALAAYLGAWWWPGGQGKPGGLSNAINVAMGGGAASPRSNVITQPWPEGLRDSDLVIVHDRWVDGRKEFFSELTPEGKVAVARYCDAQDIENPLAPSHATVADELARRLKLWKQILAEDAENADPSTLRSALVYGGAQGIWVDKKTTGSLARDGHGATVSILHTGRHYPDDLSDGELVYHYPMTRRQPGRDAAEVQATKNAAALSLPIFVILPGTRSAAKRSVRLGWVVDFDDENRQFLIVFGEHEPEYQSAPSAEMPFALTERAAPRRTTAKTRPGQQRFRFQVLAKYGGKCAVCEITHASLIKAAHICGKADNGSDDWRNGLPLCSTHHDAFDAHLFAIHPDTHVIRTMPGVPPSSIGIAVKMLTPIRQQPHPEALSWRFIRTNKLWAAQNETANETFSGAERATG